MPERLILFEPCEPSPVVRWLFFYSAKVCVPRKNNAQHLFRFYVAYPLELRLLSHYTRSYLLKQIYHSKQISSQFLGMVLTSALVKHCNLKFLSCFSVGTGVIFVIPTKFGSSFIGNVSVCTRSIS